MGRRVLRRRLLPRSEAVKEVAHWRQIETLLGANLTPERATSPLVLKHPKFLPTREGEEGILQCKLINEVRTPFSTVSERDLPLSGAFEPNLIPETSVSLVHPFRCHSSSSFPLESSYAFQSGSVFISPMVNDNLRGGASCSEGVVVPLETSNQKFKD